MAVQYDNTPLLEAVFEVYTTGAASTEGFQADLEAKLRPAYSGKRELIEPVGVHVQLGPGSKLTQGVLKVPPRVRLWSADSDRMVQFGADMCAFNALPPYRHFAGYQPAFRELVDAFLDATHAASVNALGQRYINRILLPPRSEAATYFAFYPKLPDDVARTHPPFSMLVQAAPADGGAVVVNLTYQGLQGDRPAYVLDLYARTEVERSPQWQQIESWQRRAHDAIVKCFEMAITAESSTLLGRRED